MTNREMIEEILALVDTPPAPEGDILPEYALVFEEGFLEGAGRALEIIMKYECEKQKEPSGNLAPTGEKPMTQCDTPPQRDSWIWLNRDDVDNPKVKPGDHVTFDALGRWVSGTVTRCDEDGITIREER